MGNSHPNISNVFMKFERVIDADNDIYIGIVPNSNLNSYSSQAIRIGTDGQLKRIVDYKKYEDKINIDYETGTSLTITKKNENILLDIIDGNKHIVKQMDPILIKHIKPIEFGNNSTEYDQIINFIKSTIK